AFPRFSSLIKSDSPQTWSHTADLLSHPVLLLCAESLQCKILKCNSEFWASTGQSGAEEEFCTALRAYNSCVRRTARTCRGDLAYHSAQHGIEDLMMQHNCSKEGPTSQPRSKTPQALPPPPVCHYERSLPRGAPPPNYTHCGFFGDPHLRTFTDQFQTCKVEGAWPLIHNKYLSVQVTNTPVVPGSMATLTIIFKNFQECVDQKMYHAETDELPAAFADGSKNGGERHGANTLRIVEKVPGAHVEIQARYIGTTIVVRQVGRYLTFAVRMPEEVVHAAEEGDSQDLYLCLHGCPTTSASTSTGRCRGRGAPGARDLYFQSCVFDLLSSGTSTSPWPRSTPSRTSSCCTPTASGTTCLRRTRGAGPAMKGPRLPYCWGPCCVCCGGASSPSSLCLSVLCSPVSSGAVVSFSQT
uniref:Repulsive guidance molecule BMP co-receptor a n=1 Tax=Neogobius melanostomus TaxID=47308 RepID=A0A8C6TTB2_9GOBI